MLELLMEIDTLPFKIGHGLTSSPAHSPVPGQVEREESSHGDTPEDLGDHC